LLGIDDKLFHLHCVVAPVTHPCSKQDAGAPRRHDAANNLQLRMQKPNKKRRRRDTPAASIAKSL
jgi:hypothetical protein